MMAALLLVFPGNEGIASALQRELTVESQPLQLHRFPDGESLVTLPEVAGRRLLIVCSLDRPDAKLAPLLFAADAARAQGATQVGLVAPYLAYMRQDKQFHPGEAITSRTFASLLSRHFNFLVTVDPHLHRYTSLDEIYAIPNATVSAAADISRWVQREVEKPLLVGPDAESAQWIEAVAAFTGLAHTVLSKIRHDDFNVEVSLPEAQRWAGYTPVLVDDIISSAHTMIAAIGSLKAIGFSAPVCVGVHAVFGGDAYAELQAAGAARIVTCNCVPHASNGIDVMPAVAKVLRERFLVE